MLQQNSVICFRDAIKPLPSPLQERDWHHSLQLLKLFWITLSDPVSLNLHGNMLYYGMCQVQANLPGEVNSSHAPHLAQWPVRGMVHWVMVFMELLMNYIMVILIYTIMWILQNGFVGDRSWQCLPKLGLDPTGALHCALQRGLKGGSEGHMKSITSAFWVLLFLFWFFLGGLCRQHQSKRFGLNYGHTGFHWLSKHASRYWKLLATRTRRQWDLCHSPQRRGCTVCCVPLMSTKILESILRSELTGALSISRIPMLKLLMPWCSWTYQLVLM